MSSWSAPNAHAPVDADVAVPGSKSMTARALVLSALSGGPSTISGGLLARDSQLMREAVTALGTLVIETDEGWRVEPGRSKVVAQTTIDCGLSGTVMRFVPGVAALAPTTATFVGDAAAGHRPVRPLLDALRQLGVAADAAASLPFVVRGGGQVPGGACHIDASASSQFVSGALLPAARFANGATVTNVGPPVPNRPHLTMTMGMLRRHGAQVSAQGESWSVAPGGLTAYDWAIEPDLSNAVPFFAAAMLTGGRVSVVGLGPDSVQPVHDVGELLGSLGADISLGESGITVSGTGRISGGTLDLRHLGELTPAVVALAMTADAPTTIKGVGYLRGHETDRLAALATEAERVGGAVSVRDDGLLVTPRRLRPAVWHSYRDHRMATAGAIVGLVVPGMQIDDIGSTAKTFPTFPELWHQMLSAA